MSTRSVQQILASVSASSAETPAKSAAPKRAVRPKIPAVFHRQCAVASCKRAFITSHPKHDKCSRCAGKLRKAQAVREAAMGQVEELRMCLREAFIAGALPASARVTRRNSQVVVVWQGRSHTFYAPASAQA